MFKLSFLTAVHQNSTCGAAENVGTAAKPNGIMHEPVRADRPNAFSNNSSSVLSCIQTAVDIPSQQQVHPLHQNSTCGAAENVGTAAKPNGIMHEPVLWTLYSYAVVASVLLGAAISWHVSVTGPLAARRDALQRTVIHLREAVIVAFCGVSYFEIVGSRTYQIPTKADFLASLLPLICIPAVLSLGAGAAFLLVLLLLVLAIGVIHYWASNNFYLTRIQMLLVCFLAFFLALAAFLVGWFQDKAFVGYFSFLFLVAGRALTPESGPVCLFGTEFQKNICWEFLVAGSEQGIEAGQVGLRLITKTDKQTTVKEWSISATTIADGSCSLAVMVQPESGPVCLFGTEFQKNICWEFLVAGSEQGIEAGQVGLRLITKTDKQTTVKEWSISATSIADGRWHIITLTIDAELGEATCYLDGNFDGYQTGLPLRVASCIWELGTDVWVGIRPPIDVDSFGRSDSEGAEAKVHIMDVFLWGRCLTEDEIASLPAAMGSAEYSMIDLPDDNWQWADSPTRFDGWYSDPADVDLYERDDVDWDGQYSSGRKRRSDRDGVVLDVDSFTRTLKEINQHMLSVEIAVKEALLARGESHFTDQEFPPNDRSLFMDPDNPPSKLQVVSEWMRPTDIVKEKHLGNHLCLFSGVSNSSDGCQGRLGDCWFLSAVAVLMEVSRISKVIITPEYNHEGIYTVRFCIQ
ncbi:hypothetical protein T459_34971, partial [Capsicum annuum]